MKITNQYIVVKLILKEKTTFAEESIYIANRAFSVDDGDTKHIAPDLINSISSLGEDVGRYTSRDTQATITINSAPSTLGYQKRLVDWFDRYTPINQVVKIYYYEDDENLPQPVILESSATEIWSGYCRNARFDNGKCDLTIGHLSSFTEYINYVLDSSFNDYVSTNPYYHSDAINVGTVAPIVFGNSWPIKPVQASNIETTTGSVFYLAGTGQADDYNTPTYDAGAITKLWAKDHLGVYQEQKNVYPGAGTTEVFTNASGGSTVTYTLGSINGANELYVGIDSSDFGSLGYNIGITSLIVRLRKESVINPPTQGAVTIGIYWHSPNLDFLDRQVLATMTIDYSSLSTSYADYEVVFTKPVFLSDGQTYYIGVHNQMDGWLECEARAVGYANVSRYLATSDFSTRESYWSIASTAARVAKRIYAVAFAPIDFTDDASLVQNGLYGFGIMAYQQDLNLFWCDLTNLDLVATMEGVHSGADYLNTPVKAAKYLMREYDASENEWVASPIFDDTLFSDSHIALTSFPRLVDVPLTKKHTRRTAIEAICKETESKFIFTKGKWGIYTHGCNLETSAYIYDKDLLSFRYNIEDKASLINYVNAVFGADLLSDSVSSVRFFIEGRFYNYTFNKIISSATNPELVNDSIALYGVSEKAIEIYDLVLEPTITNTLKLAIMLNKFPAEYIDVEVMYKDFQDLEIMDIVEIESVFIPAHFGSTIAPDGYAYDGDSCDIIADIGKTRAQGKKCQVRKKQIVLTKDRNAILQMTLKVNNHAGGVW